MAFTCCCSQGYVWCRHGYIVTSFSALTFAYEMGDPWSQSLPTIVNKRLTSWKKHSQESIIYHSSNSVSCRDLHPLLCMDPYTTAKAQLNQLTAPILHVVECRLNGTRRPLSCQTAVRIVFLNGERRSTWPQTCQMAKTDPLLGGGHIIMLHEIRDGLQLG